MKIESYLSDCKLCPRNCSANRLAGKLGYCSCDAGFNIASICVHQGEEPGISGTNGICNVFFSHCNLQCIYCQNVDISNNHSHANQHKLTLNDVVNRICRLLDGGCHGVGFVTPSHQAVQVEMVINELVRRNYKTTFVYNTNAYDKVEILKHFEGMIDVYLPDFKYIDNMLSLELSGAADYPQVASAAIREMYRQKGSSLITNELGIVESGLIIRHLVLPGYAAQSVALLQHIADEFSTSLAISLMSQYYPIEAVGHHKNLRRRLYRAEYEQVVAALHDLGFYKGWTQDLSSPDYYQPDFSEEQAFKL